VNLQSVQFCQEGKQFHENKHDEQDKYGLTTNQDIDILNENCYILERHKGMSENLTYEHCMDEEMESKDTRKCGGKHNQELILKDIQMVFYD
jgi:hypothetical protein